MESQRVECTGLSGGFRGLSDGKLVELDVPPIIKKLTQEPIFSLLLHIPPKGIFLVLAYVISREQQRIFCVEIS